MQIFDEVDTSIEPVAYVVNILNVYIEIKFATLRIARLAAGSSA